MYVLGLIGAYVLGAISITMIIAGADKDDDKDDDKGDD